MIPVLYRPSLWTFRNRWRTTGDRKVTISRDLLLVGLTLLLVYATYQGTLTTLTSLQAQHETIYIAPSVPLSMMMLFLFSLLFFSGAISALGSLFLGKDLELILASPLRMPSFFAGKFVEVLTSSSWMIVVFGTPMVLAFGHFYETSALFYLVALFLLLPLFCIPTALAFIAVTGFARIVPAHRARDLFLLALLAAIGSFYFFFRNEATSFSEMNATNDLMRYMSATSVIRHPWLPTYWISECLGSFLEPRTSFTGLYLTMIILATVAVVSLSYLTVALLYRPAYSRAQSHNTGLTTNARQGRRQFRFLKEFLPQPYRAIFAKEYKLFCRDMTQAVQLVLLLGLCMIYLYNFQMFYVASDLNPPLNHWWQAFLVIANLVMGAFVITAVCARFVFPSISLEGGAFWILQSSPNSLAQLLKAKFWFWFIPLGTISSVIFTSGALAIQADIRIVSVHALCSWILCYGIVGIATGLGAVFSKFNWEHSAQLTTSFGSFIFLVVSTAFVLLSIVPVAALVFLRTLRNIGFDIPDTTWYIVVGACAGVVVLLNYAATDISLRYGTRILERNVMRAEEGEK